jgi:hypothetical protein
MLKWLTDDRVLEYYEGRDVMFTTDTLASHELFEERWKDCWLMEKRL